MTAALPSVDHLHLLLDQVDQRVRYQREEWDGLDRKATTMLATTGLLLGLVAGHAPEHGAPGQVVVGFGLAVAALVLALFAGAAALWPREFRVVPEPQALVDGYAGLATDVTLGVLVSTKAKYFGENRRPLRAKLQLLLIDAFLAGLGPSATELLSANLERAGARLVRLVAEEQRHYMAVPSYHEVVELKEFSPARTNDRPVSGDRFGPFSKAVAYDGWKRSLFPVEWFDSRPERSVAEAVDDDPAVTCWVRLHVGELPILWNSGGQHYNPDFLVIDADATHWVVEVKMDKEMSSDDVKAKRDAARRWANYVNADANVDVPWRYLLVSESDVDTARGSWAALKKLGDE